MARKSMPKEQSGEVNARKRGAAAMSAAPPAGGVVMRNEIRFGRKARVVSGRM